MSTGFEKIGSDRSLQDHWLRRFVAIIIDSILMGVIAWMIYFLLTFFLVFAGLALFSVFGLALVSFLSGVLSFLYFLFMESLYGYTIGKLVMNLKVGTVDGKPLTMDKVLLRNISKIHGLFLLIDLLVGLATPGDPHQKYMDRFAGTTVFPTGASLLPPAPFTSSSS